MLDGQPTAELNNKTLADIAEGIMGVDDSETSIRYAEMKETAKKYLTMLDEAELRRRRNWRNLNGVYQIA